MQKSETRICFIVNPAADRNRSSRKIEWLREEASKRWKSYEIVIAGQHESLADLAQKKATEFEVIVACGGDGTVSQVINGIVNTDTILGVLPIGSGNDFVKSVGLDKALPECLDIIYQKKVTRIDLIRYEGDAEGWCANTIGLGLDGWANYYSHQFHRLRGQIVYFLGALRAIFNFRGCRMELTYSDRNLRDNYLMITACNGNWEGGNFLVSPEADMNDGIMNLLAIKKLPIFYLISYLLRFRWGPTPSMKGVYTMSCISTEITTAKPIAVHRDGEHLGTDIQHLRFKIEKSILQIITLD